MRWQICGAVYPPTLAGRKGAGMGEPKVRRLWEVNHPYYCEEDHYFGTGSCAPGELTNRFRSWSEFLEGIGTSDPDLNLVFRWDWEGTVADDYEPGADPNYRDGILKVMWFAQRKGFHHCSYVEVCQADEPAIREWLQNRCDHMAKLWAPLTPSNEKPKETPDHG